MEQRLNHTCSSLFFIDNEQANKKMLVPFFVQRVLCSLVIFKKLKDESHKNRKRNKGPCFYIPHIYVLVTHQCMPSTLLALRTINSRETASFMSFDKRTQQFTPFSTSKTTHCSGRECASITGRNPGIINRQICQSTFINTVFVHYSM